MSAFNIIIQTVLALWLCWEAFKESERADYFEKLSKEILENNENLIKLNSELYKKLKELERDKSSQENSP